MVVFGVGAASVGSGSQDDTGHGSNFGDDVSGASVTSQVTLENA